MVGFVLPVLQEGFDELPPGLAPEAALGALAAFAGVLFVVFIILYVYSALALSTIAKKTKTPNSWLAWIPIANLYLMTQIAKVEWWTLLVVLLGGLIPVVGSIVVLGVMAWWWYRIAEVRGKPAWLGLLTIIPVVNLVIMGIIAWTD